MEVVASKVAALYWANKRFKFAGPLTDVSKLRNQAVFMMGAGGSGKGTASKGWLKYAPGGGETGLSKEQFEALKGGAMSEQERSLSNLQFDKAVENLAKSGVQIELVGDGSNAEVPFKLYSYDQKGRQVELKSSEWPQKLPPDIYDQVVGLQNVVFKAPVHELPSYWRQVNPDIYKEELKGYMEDRPGYVHEMSSIMNKAYFLAAVQSGDPLFVDGTGTNLNKMAEWMSIAQEYGYRVSLVLVIVPLTVNQIRNATRRRNVDPDEITRQWKIIKSNFGKLKDKADKFKVIDSRDDVEDKKRWEEQHTKVNNFIERETGFPNLFEYIKVHSPEELSSYGPMLTKHKA